MKKLFCLLTVFSLALIPVVGCGDKAKEKEKDAKAAEKDAKPAEKDAKPAEKDAK